MSEKPIVSLIVLTYNTKDLIIRCLESLNDRLRGVSCEVIVVDNGSSDRSEEVIASRFPQVRLIRTEKNLGFGGGNNLGIKAARGDYLLLINSDTFLEPGTIEAALWEIQKDPEIGVLGVQLTYENRQWQPSARRFPSLLNQALTLSGLPERYPRSPFFGRGDYRWVDPEQVLDVDWVTGAFMLIPRRVIERVGDFDERFFLYYEEVDLCRRIKEAGYKVRYLGSARAVHLQGGTTSSNREFFQNRHAVRSLFRYVAKYEGYQKAFMHKLFLSVWYRLKWWKNLLISRNRIKVEESKKTLHLVAQEWKEMTEEKR